MSLQNAADALDELAAGRLPDEARVLRGLVALDPFLRSSSHEQAFYDAAAMLELFIATGGTNSMLAEARRRASEMAKAVRRVMPQN